MVDVEMAMLSPLVAIEKEDHRDTSNKDLTPALSGRKCPNPTLSLWRKYQQRFQDWKNHMPRVFHS